MRLRKQRFGYADIGRALDIPKDTVKSFCRRNGLVVRVNGQTALMIKAGAVNAAIHHPTVENETADILLQGLPRNGGRNTRI